MPLQLLATVVRHDLALPSVNPLLLACNSTILQVADERAVLKLMCAALIRAAERWRGLP
jgi:hypothetical protein